MHLLLHQRKKPCKVDFSWIKLGGVYCFPGCCCLSCCEGCALMSSCHSEFPEWVVPWYAACSGVTCPMLELLPCWIELTWAGPCLLSSHSMSAVSGGWAEKTAYGLYEGDVWLLLALCVIHPSLWWLWNPPVNPLVNQFSPLRRFFGGTKCLCWLTTSGETIPWP